MKIPKQQMLRYWPFEWLIEYWVYYTRIQPFGPYREDRRYAETRCIDWNRRRGEHDRPREPREFMPYGEDLNDPVPERDYEAEDAALEACFLRMAKESGGKPLNGW
jgi:hypothetical protein